MADAPSDMRFRLEVEPQESGLRLDAFLAARIEALSRGRATDHIAAGRVQVVGIARVKASHKLMRGQTVVVEVEPRPQMSAEPEAISLAIVYEDEDLLVVDKPAGLVVHPAAGHPGGTLVNALLHHAPQISGLGDPYRPGLVHRIDKDTSGLLVVSKNDMAMRSLARAFARHSLERRYAAITLGRVLEDELTISTLHGRHPVDRKRFSGKVGQGKPAVTHLQVWARSPLCSLVICTLETGRSHQIRMHLSERGHPIAGDAQYGGVRPHARTPRTQADVRALAGLERQALHAYALGFEHPRHRRPMRFEIGWPSDLEPVAHALFGTEAHLPSLGQPVFRGHPTSP